MQNIPKRLRVVAGAVVAIAVANFLYPSLWFSNSTRGTVLNAITQAPVANAAVSATWLIDGWEGHPVAYLQILETRTNARGEFEIPAWGPRFHFSQGRLSRTQPEIRILADGYFPLRDQGLDVTSAFFYAGRGFGSMTLRLRPAMLDDAYDSALRSFFDEFDLVRDNRRGERLRLPCTMAKYEAARRVLLKSALGGDLAATSATAAAECSDSLRGDQ